MRRNYDLLTTLELGAGDIYRIEAHRGAELRALYGDVWMTQAGECADVFLRSGDSTALRAGARSLLQAFAPSRIEIRTALPPR